ncbi:unnamed protein product [Discosporangium mesarthrocarpum]
MPLRARGVVWKNVVNAALLSLLRGFSRVGRCSTEGRALMSMDLQALALGLEDPTMVQEPKAHVHVYVNAFYFCEEDQLKWIKENWRSYPSYQMVALLNCADGGAAVHVLHKHRVKDMVAQVEALYHRRSPPPALQPCVSSSSSSSYCCYFSLVRFHGPRAARSPSPDFVLGIHPTTKLFLIFAG